MMYSERELLLLAKAYVASKGISFTTLAERCGVNTKVFRRLESGQGIQALSAEWATDWFNENWPKDVRWPDEVPDARHSRRRDRADNRGEARS